MITSLNREFVPFTQSKFSGTRKVPLRNKTFEMNFDFELSRIDCYFLLEEIIYRFKS